MFSGEELRAGLKGLKRGLRVMGIDPRKVMFRSCKKLVE